MSSVFRRTSKVARSRTLLNGTLAQVGIIRCRCLMACFSTSEQTSIPTAQTQAAIGAMRRRECHEDSSVHHIGCPLGACRAQIIVGGAELWGQNLTNKYYWNNVVQVYDTNVRYALCTVKLTRWSLSTAVYRPIPNQTQYRKYPLCAPLSRHIAATNRNACNLDSYASAERGSEHG